MVRGAVALLFAALTAPEVNLAAEPNSSWDELMKTVTVGRSVVVTRMNSAVLEGRLLAIDADAIRVRWHKQETVVPRDDVYRVRFANIRRRNTLIGMAVGAGTGAIVGVAASGDVAGAGVALLGTGVGAATGGALPIGRPLYQSPVRRSEGKP